MDVIPESVRWYLADIVLEHRIDGDPRNVVHVNTYLVKAESPDEAYEKAIDLGRGSELDYLNTDSKMVRVVFRGLRGLDVIDDPLEDGAEIAYSESVGVSEAELGRWLTPRESLGVFAPRRPKTDGPNYMPESVMRRLEAGGFDRFCETSRGASQMGVGDREVTGSWVVHRQDDNGNRFIVAVGLDREEAIRLASELEARGHKQQYWVEAAPAETAGADNRADV